MNPEWIVAIALGIGLSASAGFRVFVPLLVAAVAGKTGILPLSEGFLWMSSWAAIICFGTATILEILAYYIPVVDNLLDAVNTPLAIAGGTLLATSVLPGDHELLKWVSGLLVGGTSAGIIHAGTSLLRFASTKTTAGAGNAVLSTGEHIAAFGTSISALFIPLFVAVVILFFLFYLISKMVSYKKGK
jgi:hypothetical protein